MNVVDVKRLEMGRDGVARGYQNPEEEDAR
jgi:hypothetical protein